MCQIGMLVGEAEIRFWRNVAKENFPKLIEMYEKKEIDEELLKKTLNFAIGKTKIFDKKLLNKVCDF